MTGITRNEAELLETLLTVTTMFALPAASEAGTAAVTLESLQEEIDAAAEPKVTRLAPCAAPKPEPVIVMGWPAAPRGWEMPEMEGPD